MLTAIRGRDGWKFIARYAERADGPYICAVCNKEVLLKKGDIKTNYFSHRPPITCSLGVGESEFQMNAKMAIFDALQPEPNVTDLEIEKHFGSIITDVFARINGVAVAIEIPRSNQTVADIVSKILAYHELGIGVLWIGLPTDVLVVDRYSPKDWEKWIHTAYYGRLYFWIGGQTFAPVHFGHYHENGPDGERVSKRLRAPLKGVPVSLSKDFRLVKKEPWSSAEVSIPPCTLYMDKQLKWWR